MLGIVACFSFTGSFSFHVIFSRAWVFAESGDESAFSVAYFAMVWLKRPSAGHGLALLPRHCFVVFCNDIPGLQKCLDVLSSLGTLSVFVYGKFSYLLWEVMNYHNSYSLSLVCLQNSGYRHVLISHIFGNMSAFLLKWVSEVWL